MRRRARDPRLGGLSKGCARGMSRRHSSLWFHRAAGVLSGARARAFGGVPAARLRARRFGAAGRQYRGFAGVAHGRHSQVFFDKLIAGGFALRLAQNRRRSGRSRGRPSLRIGSGVGDFATTDLAAPAHAGRIYHVQFKPWYRAIGEPHPRHRRAMSAGRTVDPSTAIAVCSGQGA
jgi:hypothetical protein